MNNLPSLQEIMNKQPIVNIGMIGHVANGKSTLVKSLTNKETQQFSKEKERSITIRLGYANAKIWKCMACFNNSNCAAEAFSSSNSLIMNKCCTHCNADLLLVNHISIVDCPGHNELTSTMLNGSSVMDHAILVEACNNENIPAPQTAEHLIATRAANIPTAMIIMNKIDLVKREKANDQVQKISKYVTNLLSNNDNKKDNDKEEADKKDDEKKDDETYVVPPIVPITATFNINIDTVCQYLSYIKVPANRNPNSLFKMIIIRSFDANKPGDNLLELKGGVIGGTIMRGTLKIGERLNIYPGIFKKIEQNEKKHEGADYKYEPITGQVISIEAHKDIPLTFAIPGGLLGIQLTIDPAFSRDDKLSGSMVLRKIDVDNDKNLVKVYDKIIIKINTFIIDKKKVNDIFKERGKDNLLIMINVNSNNVDCKIKKYLKSKHELYLYLNKPIAIDSIDNLCTIMHKNINRGALGSKDILARGIIFDGELCEELI